MKIHLIIAAALAFCSCGGNRHKASDPLTDNHRTQRTDNLLNNLKAYGDSTVYLVGHHDDTVYGIGWQADYNNDSTVHQSSDVKAVCNDYPALLGFDLEGIEKGSEVNQDGVPFKRIKEEIIAHFDRGGMVTLSWTVDGADKQEADIERVAVFLNALETPYGVKVPVVFRLRGQFDKSLWQNVVSQLKASEVVNVLYAYSPANDPEGDETKYLENYPGDELIDVLGVDCYCVAPDADTTQIAQYAERLDLNLSMVCRLAKQRQKVVGLTETGYEGLKQKDWWTSTLAPVLAHHPVSYVLLWRNAHNQPSHFFAPYPGQKSSSDFIRFYNDRRTLFLSDVNGLYLQP